jgi:Flp pilus assembly protein TadD
VSAESLDRAQLYLASGQSALALPLITSHLGTDPDDYRGLCYLASCLVELGEYGEAVIAAEDATKRRPDDARGWQLLSVAARSADLHALARLAAVHAVELDPLDATNHRNLAEATLRGGATGSATIATARRAIDLAPGDPAPHVTLGNVYWSLNRKKAAIKAYRAALAIDPNDDAARSNLALVALTAGDVGVATRSHAELLAETPSDDDYLLKLRLGAERALLTIQALVWAGILVALALEAFALPIFPIPIAFAALGIAGYLGWHRVRGGHRIGAYAAGFARLDRLWSAWAAAIAVTLIVLALASVTGGLLLSILAAAASSLLGIARLVLK